MGTKIHNKLPFQIKRIENFKVFKNKKVNYFKTALFSTRILNNDDKRQFYNSSQFE
jgi:hypothetical protein